MRPLPTLFFLSLLSLPALLAAEPAPNFGKQMKGIEDNLNELQTNLTDEDKVSALAYAGKIKTSFHNVEEFFATWADAKDAVTFSQEYQQRANRIIDFINAGDLNKAYEVSVDMSKHCKACHDNYKPL